MTAIRGEVELELDGRAYVLVFDWNAVAQIEAAFGDKAIEEIFFAGQIPRRAIIEAVRAGLMRRYRPLSAKKVGDMISRTVGRDEGAYAGLVRGLVRGILAGLGASEEKLKALDDALDEEIDDAAEKSGGVDAGPRPTIAETGPSS